MRKFAIIVNVFLFSFPAFSKAQSDTNSKKWSTHFQLSIIEQWHGSYHFPYAGPSSLDSNKEHALSITSTLFLGRRLWKDAAVYFNPEITGGSGLSLTRGAAGFPNGEIYRVGNQAPTPFLARGYIQQHFVLKGNRDRKTEDDINQLQGSIPTSRITVNVGKFCLADFFDGNTYNHEARTQFLNWSLMQQGAWDFPADTRGYTSGIEVELVKPTYAIRYSLVQVSKTANALDMDWRFFKYNGQTLEFETIYSLGHKPGVVRFTAFMNTTRAPKYAEVVSDLKQGDSSLVPVLAGAALGPDKPSIKFGLSLNIEQTFGPEIGAFFRAGWNDGKTASWMFTDIDQNLQVGVNAKGKLWQRPLDNFGVAVAINGISRDHQNYLKAGGWSFIIGDGYLTYSPEQIFETFYRAQLNSFLSFSLDYQILLNPGYNRDRRGPLSIPGIRIHIKF